jgi:hypothetical protein
MGDGAKLRHRTLRRRLARAGRAHGNPHAAICRELLPQLDPIAACRALGRDNVALHDQVEAALLVEVRVERRRGGDLQPRAARHVDLLSHALTVDREVEHRSVGDEHVARLERRVPRVRIEQNIDPARRASSFT